MTFVVGALCLKIKGKLYAPICVLVCVRRARVLQSNNLRRSYMRTS